MKHLILFTGLIFIMISVPARAELRLAKVFADNAVLQRQRPVPVWGWTEPGKTVTVSFHGVSTNVTADVNGKFMAYLPAMEANASGSNLTVSASGETTVTLANVVVGEVWICTGQSNMARTMLIDQNAGYTNRTPDIAAANFPSFRYYDPEFNFSDTPIDDLDARQNHGKTWQVMTPTTARNAYSLAFYFGRDIHTNLNVPVGLLQLALSGSGITGWVPKDAARFCRASADYAVTETAYWTYRDKDGGRSNEWPVTVANWETAWDVAFSNSSTLPKKPIAATFGDDFYKLGGHGVMYNALQHPVAPYAIRGGIWFQGEANQSSGGGDYLHMLRYMVESWRKQWGQDFFFIAGQIAPQPPELESEWQPIPVYTGHGRPELLEDFLLSEQFGTSNFAITVNIDLYNHLDDFPINIITGNGVHFEAKAKAGNRMARVARARLYGETNVIHKGPVCTNMIIQGSTVRLQFGELAGGLILTSTDPRTNGFGIAGANKVWYFANVTQDGNDLLVSSASVASPVAVRYAWHSQPHESLFNAAGLPASPFRTDRFPTTDKTLVMNVATNITVSEGGSVNLPVVFNNNPNRELIVTAERIGGSDAATFSNAPLKFDWDNGDQTQNFTITGGYTPGAEDQVSIYRLKALEADDPDVDVYVTVLNTNTELIVTSTGSVSVAEGGTATFGLKLSNLPSRTITVAVARVSGDTDLSVQGSSAFLFTTNNWDTYQTCTLQAAQDGNWQNGSAVFRCSSDLFGAADVTATETDDDPNPEIVLPFSETFDGEGMASSAGPLNGQHSWSATSGATVTNGTAHGGSQSLALTEGSASHTFNNGSNHMSAGFWTIPVSGTAPDLAADAAAQFWFNTNGNLVVYSNTTALTLSATAVSNAWNKIEVEVNYASNVWKISLNGTNAAQNLGLYSARSDFSEIGFQQPSFGSAFVDDLTISNIIAGAASALDNWLVTHYGTTNVNTGAVASNGVNTILQAYIAGLDPNDPSARLELSGVQPLTWNASSGRVYTVYWTSNLLSGFQTLETNYTGGAFTDTIHGAANEGFYKIEVRLP